MKKFQFYNIINIFLLEYSKILLDVIKYKSNEILNEFFFLDLIFKKKLKNENLNIKLGIDCTFNSFHLGHLVLFNKIFQLSKFNFNILILLGLFTAKIGDPSYKDNKRKLIEKNFILSNTNKIIKQLNFLFFNIKFKIYYNIDWLNLLNLNEITNLLYSFKLSWLLERNDFKKRYFLKNQIKLNELFYSIFQSYDSVFLKSDIELGGLDQKLNFFITRNFQKYLNLKLQLLILMPLLKSLNNEKMSKTKNNCIYIYSNIYNFIHNLKSISDKIIFDYCEFFFFDNFKNLNKFFFIKNNNYLLKLILCLEILKILYNKNFLNFLKEFINFYENKKFRYFKLLKIKINYLILFKLFKFINLFDSTNRFIYNINQNLIKINGLLIKNFFLILFKGKYMFNYKNIYIYIIII